MKGACLRCEDAPCFSYSPEEISLGLRDDFPLDGRREVCPTDAIRVDDEDGLPRIEQEKCISCALCADRCPAFAIGVGQDGAWVEDSENELFEACSESESAKEKKRASRILSSLPTDGKLISGGEEFLKAVLAKIESVGVGGQFPNHLVRNLMLAIGIPWQMRRLGDTNVRIDAIFASNSKTQGVAEVELAGTGILDAPRNILDDLAVVISRYKWKSPYGLIVVHSLPNKRSEYWQVISDVKKVLTTRILTISLGVLLLMLWEDRTLRPFLSSFYADRASRTIRRATAAALGRKVRLPAEIIGAVEASK